MPPAVGSRRNCVNGGEQIPRSPAFVSLRADLRAVEGSAEQFDFRADDSLNRVPLATVENWDGDTQEDIYLAISRFSRLLNLANKAR